MVTSEREEGNMTSERYYSNVQVLYQLGWEGKLEHPHMIAVQYPSDQDGLRLRDVKKRLTALRGKGIGHSFSWSYKRNYTCTFIWNDLGDDDVIHPLCVSGEYVLKASVLIDTFATKPAGNRVEHQNERKRSACTSQISRGCGLDTSNRAVDRHSGTVSIEKLANGAVKCGDSKKDESTKGVAIDIPQTLPPLSVEQETIDVEKSDFCLSSSDNEISPRSTKMTDSKPAEDHGLIAMTSSPIVQGLQTPSRARVASQTEAPFSPGSAKRLWKKEIRKSLFRTQNTNTSPSSEKHDITSENVCENATSQAEKSPLESCREDASLGRDSRSKSIGTLDLKETKEKEKEAEQSTSQLIRLLWARWTGGSSKGKRISNSTCDSSAMSNLIGEAAEATKTEANLLSGSCQSHTKSPCKKTTSPTQVEEKEIPQKEPQLRATQKAARLPFNEKPTEGEVAAMSTPQPDAQELRTEHGHSSLLNLQVVLDSPTADAQGWPPVAEVETPNPAIASVKNSNGLPRVKTSVSSKSLPPGFHKGTNDTKPVQTPPRGFLSSIPLASPPLRRSFSKPDASSGRVTGIDTITTSPEEDSLAFTPSLRKSIHEIKKCINLSERNERPLIPGVTTLDSLGESSARSCYRLLTTTKLQGVSPGMLNVRTDIQARFVAGAQERVPFSAVCESILSAGIPAQAPISSSIISLPIHSKTATHALERPGEAIYFNFQQSCERLYMPAMMHNTQQLRAAP